jgi:hypothetical protein
MNVRRYYIPRPPRPWFADAQNIGLSAVTIPHRAMAHTQFVSDLAKAVRLFLGFNALGFNAHVQPPVPSFF